MGDPNHLPRLPSSPGEDSPWVQAMQAARRRLPRVKVAIAAAGTVAFGALAAVAAGSTGTVAATPAASTSPATFDVFGQGTQPGVDNPPAGAGQPAGGQDNQLPAQPAPAIVSAQS